MLTPRQRRSWFADGFLHLPSFFDDARIDAITDVHERTWHERSSEIAVDSLHHGVRYRLSEAPEGEGRRFKLNDLYLREPTILDLGLDARLVGVLEQLLVDPPVLINSLDVDYGTQQAFHTDALFMTPPAPGNLVAAWIALEDGHLDSGPLQYYPGSHHIWPYRFSTGKNTVVSDEMDKWSKYMDAQVAAFELAATRFVPKKGDLFIWNAYLLHGGGTINDPSRTRRTSIFHYFSESAIRPQNPPLVAHNGGFWWNKPPVFVNQIFTAAEQREEESPVETPQARMEPGGRSLRARLATLASKTRRRLREWRSERPRDSKHE